MTSPADLRAAPTDLDAFLRERFGLPGFHPWQREAIAALLGEPGRVLVVAPTGGGKSLTYQLPAAVLDGTTLVISPLVALMEDQVRALDARGVRATYLASTLDKEARRDREARMARGEYKLVYVAPERLASDFFVRLAGRIDVSLVAIDEAHCIAQWGHDFRPDYLRIGALLETLKPPRVLACTATATPLVRKEIRAQLGLDERCVEVLRGFARPNLHLEARWVDGAKDAKRLALEAIARAVGDARAPRGAAIVYAATRKTSEQWAELAAAEGYRAAAYHAGLDAARRSAVSAAFADRKLDVVAATNAFGMGIDRPDIRAVVHVQPPSSIEAYYQEVGRAGRDGGEAHGLLLCSGSDVALRRRLVESNGGDDGPASADLAARAWGLFRELLLYLDARTCRHDFVLRYFGDEQETLGGCGHCDVCVAIDDARGDAAPEDDAATRVVVQKALSAVARANRRAGLVAIAEMLRGDDSERTRKFGFTALSTFGLLRDRSLAWIQALLRSLLAAGWIDLTPTEHPVPLITAVGWEVMQGRRDARLQLPVERPARTRRRDTGARAQPGAAALELPEELRPLFERLRAHRAEVAKTRGVPPYVVAHDRTLADLAQKRPRTPEQLREVHGFGPARIAEYGAGFLAVLHPART